MEVMKETSMKDCVVYDGKDGEMCAEVGERWCMQARIQEFLKEGLTW